VAGAVVAPFARITREAAAAAPDLEVIAKRQGWRHELDEKSIRAGRPDTYQSARTLFDI
jgi:hypothetical protein